MRFLAFLLIALLSPTLTYADQLTNGQLYYEHGEYERNNETATKLFEKALSLLKPLAEQGNAEAQVYMGRMYNNGQGVKQNPAEALKWYLKAAEQKDTDALHDLARMYEDGRDVKQDYAEAFKWYSKSAEQGHRDDQELIAAIYLEDKDHAAHEELIYFDEVKNFRSFVKQDTAVAVKWFQRAANQGSVSSSRFLAESYMLGAHDLPKDLVQAYMWNIITRRLIRTRLSVWPDQLILDADKKYADKYERDMTAEQIIEAKHRSAEWKPILEKPTSPSIAPKP